MWSPVGSKPAGGNGQWAVTAGQKWTWQRSVWGVGVGVSG